MQTTTFIFSACKKKFTVSIKKVITGVGTTLISTAKLVRCSQAQVVWVTLVSRSLQPNVDHWPDIVLSKLNDTITPSEKCTKSILTPSMQHYESTRVVLYCSSSGHHHHHHHNHHIWQIRVMLSRETTASGALYNKV